MRWIEILLVGGLIIIILIMLLTVMSPAPASQDQPDIVAYITATPQLIKAKPQPTATIQVTPTEVPPSPTPTITPEVEKSVPITCTLTLTPSFESDEYLAYSFVIEDLDLGGNLLVIEKTSVIPHLAEDFQSQILSEMPGLDEETVHSFVEENQEIGAFEEKFKISSPYILLSNEEYQAFFGKNLAKGYEDFYARFPEAKGIISLTKAGMDPSHTQAFLYGAYQIAPVNGVGYFYLLEKVNGAWAIQKKMLIWVS